MKPFILSIFFIVCSSALLGNTNVYFVHFTDKSNTPYNISAPQNFLSQRAIDRRLKFNIPIDSSDLPNNPSYLDSLTSLGASRVISLKWQQGALIYANVNNAQNIANLSFIDTVQLLNSLPTKIAGELTKKVTKIRTNHIATAQEQIQQINLSPLHDAGYKGQNIHIAVIDAGYLMADQLNAFATLRNENRILSTADFVDPQSDIYAEHVHGTAVLSTMAAQINGTTIGTCPEASFHLLRSENYNSETISELYYWCRAAEYADSIGADIITSSLGYFEFDNPDHNLTFSDLDGTTSVCAIAATCATQKGIAVLVSAGNEGNTSWQHICTPSDALNIMCIGATNSNGQYASFSSQGPSADGRTKPDFVTRGAQAAIISSNDELGYANGTSFSCPIAAGMVACIMQAAPSATPEQILLAINSTASQSNTPDNLLGHGIPNAQRVLQYLVANSNNSNTTVKTEWSLEKNPTSDTFAIVNSTEPLEYLIYSQTAQLVQSGTIYPNQEEPLHNIPNGAYILQLRNNKQQQSTKLLIH